MADFGDCVWYKIPGARGRDKWDSRWEEGVYLGVRARSNEVVVASQGKIRFARNIRRRPEDDRIDPDEILNLKVGPGGMHDEPDDKEGPEDVAIPVPMEDVEPKPVPRSFQITLQDVRKHVVTSGCPGC